MFLRTFLLLILVSGSLCFELPALQSVLSFFGGGKKNSDKLSIEELGLSKGQCNYNFLNVITKREEYECAPDDYYILHLLRQSNEQTSKKPPILVKCLQSPVVDTNVTDENMYARPLMMNSVKDIVELLKPIGNATKRHEVGSCVLVFFYTPTSLSCAQVAFYANVLPALFPSIKMAAIDAFRFPTFNTEFGIVGLPTLLLFHQGRPIVKFYSDIGTFAAFVTRHTGIMPLQLSTIKLMELQAGPIPPKPVYKRDYLLFVAWLFILSCLMFYVSKTQWYLRLVDFIKRNWRESEEAQMGPN